MSGDKKANLISLSKVRGKKVISEILITKEVIKNILQSSAEKITKFWQTGTLAALQTGAVGNHAHAHKILNNICTIISNLFTLQCMSTTSQP